MMDHSTWKDKDLHIDLERGVSSSHQDCFDESASSARKQANNLLARGSVGFVDGSNKVENGFISFENPMTSNGGFLENLEVATDKLVEADNLDNAEKRSPTEKRKKPSNKKPPRPPRPPRGPSIDAADQKMIREIAELAMLKKARIERMKAIKKMKTTKSSSCSGNILAMVFTVLFFLVIVFQGKYFYTSTQSYLLNYVSFSFLSHCNV